MLDFLQGLPNMASTKCPDSADFAHLFMNMSSNVRKYAKAKNNCWFLFLMLLGVGYREAMIKLGCKLARGDHTSTPPTLLFKVLNPDSSKCRS